jgi:hypothetical protein
LQEALTGSYAVKPALIAEHLAEKDVGARFAFGRPLQVASNTATPATLTIPTRLLSIKKLKATAKVQMLAGDFGNSFGFYPDFTRSVFETNSNELKKLYRTPFKS